MSKPGNKPIPFPRLMAESLLVLIPLAVWLFILSAWLMEKSAPANFSGEVSGRIALKDPRVFRLAVFSDVHDNFAVMDRVMREAETRADAALLLGDFCQRGLIIEYRLYLDHMRRAGFKIPLYTAIGNHDLGFRDDSGKLYREFFGPDHFCWRFGQNLIVVVNNVENDLWPAELAWLKDTLAQEEGTGSVLLLQHKPPYLNPEFPGMTEGRSKKLAQVVKGSPISAIVAGHAHERKDFKWSDVPVTVMASAGGWQEADPPAYGYLLIECSETECASAYHDIGYVSAGPQIAKWLLVDCYWGWLILSGAAAGFIAWSHWRRRSAR